MSKPRKIDYSVNIIEDDIPGKIYEGSNYEAYKLQIKKRYFETELGEINFLIRDRSNNLKFILVYCLMKEPEQIFRIEYYINDTIQLPSKEVVRMKPLMDSEIAELFVKDLISNYISKKYKIV
jgi:hypothetical protein